MEPPEALRSGEGRTQAGLYLHVPFCRTKCPYCDFYSLPCPQPPEEEFLEAAKREILRRREEVEGLVFTTFYAGGGTPSLLSPAFYEELFAFLAGTLRFAPVEATLEANPEGLTLEGLLALRRVFNRLSLGLQSLSPRGLRRLGRRHTVEEGRRAFLLAREAGFDNVSVDLIFAWPGQRAGDLAQELDEALELRPDHLSLYELSLEEGTDFHERARRGELAKPPEEEIVAMFHLIWERLGAAGYEHYEISNHARPGRRCRHNLLYWREEPFLGIGPGAASFLRGVRRRNRTDLGAWLAALRAGGLPPAEEERLDQEALFREAVVLGLRLREGVSPRELRERFGFDLGDYYGPVLERLHRAGLVRWRRGRLALTRKGVLLANVVARELV